VATAVINRDKPLAKRDARRQRWAALAAASWLS